MFEIILLIILILLNAFFVMMEMSFITINDLKIENAALKGNKKAKKINEMIKQPSKFLATIQIGITFVGFLSSAIASSTFADNLTPILHKIIKIDYNTLNIITIIIITIILSFLMLIFGELVPKRIGMKYRETIAYKTINILKIISNIFKPFVFLLTKITNIISKLFGINEQDEEIVTEEEVKMLVDEALEFKTLQKYERDYIHNVLKLNDIKIKNIMTLKKDTFSLDINTDLSSALNILIKEKIIHNKIPITEKTKVIGILHSKDIIKNINNKDINLKNIIKTPIYIESNKFIYETFNVLKNNKSQIAIITENNKYIGIVTMEDILEEIVGDLYDEFDKNNLTNSL